MAPKWEGTINVAHSHLYLDCYLPAGFRIGLITEIAAQWLMLELAGTLPRAQTVTAAAPETHLFASR
ncbi:hypothetical protein ACFPOA_13885 [Lysobacter niabensis]|uniref:hypothetical protein n=1 Tax=Agrilutibacter niabensis TaxID=380628 RepID=UPI0036112482